MSSLSGMGLGGVGPQFVSGGNPEGERVTWVVQEWNSTGTPWEMVAL